jgi:hypothetical protein
MDAPMTNTADSPPASSLEKIELELALQAQDTIHSGFENALRQALEKAGGVLLFHMRLEDGESSRWTAAVAVGQGEERQFLIVSIPSDGAARIQPLEESDDPIARIAPAFADVMERLQAAA